ncbi:Hypothetical predicted protein [Lecanosticta acicola]|uniref:Uncharacterized protein n=1 Tax=Lecanosticta acicola TaxID=111012 RepID=A0AAI9EAI4_9PEZI|nr:Hypothetical predicted protein [Lecanosticta acicola]
MERCECGKCGPRICADNPYTYIPGPSQRLLVERGRKLIALAEQEEVAVPTHLLQEVQEVGKLWTRNSELIWLLRKGKVEVSVELADLAAEPIKLVDLPAEILQNIMYFTLDDVDVELRHCEGHCEGHYGHPRSPFHVSREASASRKLYTAALTQVMEVSSAMIDSGDPGGQDAWSWTSDRFFLEDKINHYKFAAIRHLNIRLNGEVFRVDMGFDVEAFHHTLNAVCPLLKTLSSVFVTLKTLHVTLNGGSWGSGVGLKNWPQLSATTEGQVVNLIDAMRGLHLRWAELAFLSSLCDELVDFRGLEAAKAAKWICRQTPEDRVFRL